MPTATNFLIDTTGVKTTYTGTLAANGGDSYNIGATSDFSVDFTYD
jgi:hypothetical protein